MILLVEDHALLRGILARALEALGYEVRAAASADDALVLLENGLMPELVFTDIRMPGSRSGVDLARWVQANSPETRVLLQTGFAHENTADFPVLHKPYTPDELAAAIVKVLSSKAMS